ncbi:MAG: glycosyltransferase [Coriobacteriia bacterium]|nr:glycosyltransferase [Coriobacteriia bacterium]
MRIALVNKYYFPPHLGGIETYMQMLAEGLAARPGVCVEAIVSNEGDETVREVIKGVEVLRLARAFAASSTPVAFGMAEAIRAAATGTERSDLFHLQFPYPWGDWAWQRAGSPGPMVLTYHSDIVRQRVLGAAYRPVMARLLDRASRIIVASPPMIENSPFLRPHADKCRVVPFGIDVERYAPTPEHVAAADAIRARHARPIVLFVGRLIYYKGVDVLVRAMADFDADVVLVGNGPLEGELRELAVSLGVADRLTFVPPVTDDELAAYMRAADVFCLPSVARSEAFGIVQLEAHASGTPVVCTDLPTGVPWVNRDGETGLVVPVGDAAALASALRRLLSDDALRVRMGERARERVLAEFTVERMVENTVSVYEEALDRKGV